MATPQDRLAGLEERITRRRDRNIRLSQRLERRTHDNALKAAGVDVARLELDPATGGIRRGSSAADAIVARQRARDRVVRGEVPGLQTEEQQREAVRQLTPRTGDRSRNVTDADRLLAEARPVERFIARQQAFTPLGGLSKAVESVAGGLETAVVDPLAFVGAGTGARGPLVRGIQRRRALEAATEEQPEFGDLSHRLASVGTDVVRVGGELGFLRGIPRVGPVLAGEVPSTLRAGAAGSRLARVARRGAVEGAAAGLTEGVVAVAEGADTEEAVRRQQFGFVAGAAIGGVVGGVAERLAARRAARTAAGRARALGDAALAERTLTADADAFAREQQLLAQEEETLARAFEGRIGPERQLPPARPDTPPGAIPAGGETASLREQLRARHNARRAREALPTLDTKIQVEGLTDVAERAIRTGEIPGEAATTRSSTRPPPADEAEGVVRSLRRRIADALDPERARELQEAYTDRLTGLRNQEAFRRARPRLEADRSTEFVLIDLRNFKGVNDLISMKAGDEKLQQVADVIERVAGGEVGARNLFRAGGDEFVVAVPRGQGARIGRQIVREVGSTPIADTPLSFGARFGVGNTFDAADVAAKAAKADETGVRFRDAREMAGDPPPTVSQTRSMNENMSRTVQVRRQKGRRAASEPTVTGRNPKKPTRADTKGPNGPVDLEIDAKSGKPIPNTRTAAVRQKSAFSDSGEGGYLVNPKRDALEATPEANLQPHEKRVQDQISVGESRSLRDRLPSLLDLYTMLFRRTAGIEEANRLLGGTGKGSIDDAAVAAHLASGAERRAEAFMEYGPGRWAANGEWEQTGTPGLFEILAPLSGKLNVFRRYLTAARTLEVGKREIKTGISLEDAARIVAETPEQIKQAQRQLVSYLRDVARYYADATGMPEERLQGMFALGEDFIPLTRVFEGKDPLSVGAGTVGRAGQVFRRLTGSRRRIQDPIESAVDYTKRLIQAADINRIAKNLVDAAEDNPERAVGLMAKIERPPQAMVSQAAERLKNAAAARGRPMADDEAIQLAEALGADNLNISDDVVRVWRGGKLEAYRVAPSIARGIRALQPRDMDMFLKLMGLIPRGLKAGVTLNPGFQVFNIIRDSFDAQVQSEYGFSILKGDPFRGFYQSMKARWFGQASEVYQQFAGTGGGFATARGVERRSTQQLLRRALPRVQSRTGRLIDVATMPLLHPVQALKIFAAPFEEAARVGEFMRAKSAGATAVDAVLASKKVTVDFQQMGSAMQGVSYATAFLNAGIQSLDTAIRVGIRPITKAAAEETAGAAAVTFAKEAAQVYGFAVGAISLPSIYFWAAGRGDVEIEDLRKSEAGLIYWFARTPQGEIIRLPKPFLWGQIFGTGMEAALDKALEQDPEAMERWATGIRDMAMVNMIPNAVQIPVEQFANRSIAFGTPIVPQELERVEPRMQATERTSRLARKLGEITNQSPARIDKIMRDVGGTLPADLLRAMDQAIDRFEGDAITEPEPTASDMAFFGRFFQRDPSLSVESVQTFWDNAIAAEQAMNTFRMLEERGDAVALGALFDRRVEDFAVAALYEGSRQQISELRNAIDAVRTMPDDMFQEGEDPAVRKREMVDEFTRQYLQIARVTNEVAADILTGLETADAR